MFVLIILLMTAEGPQGLIYNQTFTSGKACVATLREQAKNLPIVYGDCFEVPGETA